MHISEVVILTVYFLLSPPLTRWLRYPEVWSICWFAAAPYPAVLLINWILPYEYSYPRNAWVAPFAISAIMAILFTIYHSFGKSLVREKRLGLGGRSPLEATAILFVLAYAGVALLLLEFVLNPASRLSDDMYANREAMNTSGLLGTVSKTLAGAGLLLLQVCVSDLANAPVLGTATHRLARWRRIAVYIIPYVITSMIGLLSGNRQYVVMGILLTVFTILYRKGLKWIFRPSTVLIAITILLLTTLFSILRNRDVAGRHEEFMRYGMGITERDYNPFASLDGINVGAMYVYLYYGIEFNVLSVMVDNELYSNLPFVGSFPIIYRRLQGHLGLPNQLDLIFDRGEQRKSITRAYGGVWGTMFSSFYGEFGLISLFSYPAILCAFIGIIGSSMRGYESTELLFVAFLLLVAFGVQFFITSENAAFGYFLCVLLPGRFLLQRKPRRRFEYHENFSHRPQF